MVKASSGAAEAPCCCSCPVPAPRKSDSGPVCISSLAVCFLQPVQGKFHHLCVDTSSEQIKDNLWDQLIQNQTNPNRATAGGVCDTGCSYLNNACKMVLASLEGRGDGYGFYLGIDETSGTCWALLDSQGGNDPFGVPCCASLWLLHAIWLKPQPLRVCNNFFNSVPCSCSSSILSLLPLLEVAHEITDPILGSACSGSCWLE